jgi:hypothetical protein
MVAICRNPAATAAGVVVKSSGAEADVEEPAAGVPESVPWPQPSTNAEIAAAVATARITPIMPPSARTATPPRLPVRFG